MNITLGKKIQYLRKEKGLCQLDLCSKILSRTVLSKIENDRVIPSIFQLLHISKILNVSMESLLNLSSYKIPINSNGKIYDSNILYNLYIKEDYYSIISTYEKGIIDINNDVNYLFYVGYSYYFTDFFEPSSKILKKYINIYTTLDENIKKHYTENFSTALNLLCKIYCDSRNYTKAISCVYKAKKALEKYNMKNTTIYSLVIYNLGHLYLITHQYNKSINLLESYIKNTTSLIYLKVLPAIHLNLNIAYYNIDNYKKSIDHIKSSIDLYNYINNKDMMKNCYLNYINALRYSHKFEEAFSILNKFRDLYWSTLQSDIKINFLMQEVILYFNINNFDIVLSLINKFNLNQLDSYNRNVYYFIKGHIYYINKYYNQSYTYLIKCEKYFISHNYIYDLKLLYTDLYEMTNNSNFKIQLDKYAKTTDIYKKNIVIF